MTCLKEFNNSMIRSFIKDTSLSYFATHAGKDKTIVLVEVHAESANIARLISMETILG